MEEVKESEELEEVEKVEEVKEEVEEKVKEEWEEVKGGSGRRSEKKWTQKSWRRSETIRGNRSESTVEEEEEAKVYKKRKS